MKKLMKRLTVTFLPVVTMLTGVAIGAVAVSLDNDQPTIPQCAEDDIIVGTGDYQDGEWEGYDCSHADLIFSRP